MCAFCFELQCVGNGTTVYQFNYTDNDYNENAESFFNIIALGTDNLNASLKTFTLTKNGALMVKGNLDVNRQSTYEVVL